MPDTGLVRNGVREYRSIVVHNSGDNEHQTTAQIRVYHMRPKEQDGRGWKEIGYNRVIEWDGSVHMGRPDAMVPAGAEGYNEDSLHVCVVGNYDKLPFSLDDPRGKALVQTVAKLARDHKIAVSNIIGHRDVYVRLGQPVAKSCPGDHIYAAMPALRAKVAEYLK